jgi:hypothetical protein
MVKKLERVGSMGSHINGIAFGLEARWDIDIEYVLYSFKIYHAA